MMAFLFVILLFLENSHNSYIVEQNAIILVE